ncbi:MAG TPA: alpha/beta hydrolase [Leptospiraceae bacterium]|nr:alpha/beta hydrolase [Leptospiraceae bacterium]HMW07960.1 alpha/beta hydrolase [Leptospiraceae bacterium]HMX34964.1 alpha/beta hydrolase [Leptospiraceae bacterium]HMY34382.1 alpha/beta hydrolase [Leptospiraceae bacterium]HMZ66907.1 alpha/beta hydrolase [Leptospiraceae bacterium]
MKYEYLETEDGFNIGYSVVGEGTPILVIGSKDYYPKTFPNLPKKDFQLIHIDTRAFCNPEKEFPESAFELSKFLNDIQKIQNRLNIPKAVILGHSIHSYFALEYSRQFPNLTSGLILLATSPFSGFQLIETANRYFGEIADEKRKSLLNQNLQTLEMETQKNPEKAFVIRMLKFAPMIWYDPSFDANDLWEGVQLNSQGANLVWGKMFSEYKVKEILPSISVPIFLGLGKYDFWNPVLLWDEFKNISNLKIKIFEKSGHTPQLEESELFYKELKNFLIENHLY